MELRPIDLGDLWLYEAVHCDPLMMEHLGGPLPKEGLAEKLQRDVATTAAGETWVLKIIPDDEPDTAAGTVSIWDHVWKGDPITEIGWMVLPRFQGRGMGSEAVGLALSKARSERRWEVLHAFPNITNGPSNAICRKFGFINIGECEFEFRGRPIRGNHWRLDLRAGPR